MVRKTLFPFRSVMRWPVLAVVVWGCMSCQTSDTPLWISPSERLVWPLPPERPRIEYLGALKSSGRGRRGGPIGRLSRLVLGKKDIKMVKPLGVAKNEAGLMAVADPTMPTVHFFDLVNQKDWNLKPKLAARLRSPVGIAVNAEGRVFVSDSVLGKVFVFEHGERLVQEFGEGSLVRPTGLALSPNEDLLYVVDTLACQIVVFNRDGEKIRSFGERGALPGQFNFPTYIATTPDGDLCVSDSLNFRVQLFHPDGTFKSSFGRAGDGAGNFARPKGIGVDTFGRIYVVDAAFEVVQVFEQDGTLLLAFGGQGTGPGEFSLPGGMFLDKTNTIWVADSFNQRIQAFRLLEEDE